MILFADINWQNCFDAFLMTKLCKINSFLIFCEAV